MNTYKPETIRNVVLLGHSGSGKTTLTEALLFQTQAIHRLGRVQDGTATTDTEPEELKHHISASLGLAPLEFDGHKINLLDAPGFVDFAGEIRSALAVADLAVVVVSAVDGVEVGTEIAWNLACEAGIARMFFVNKLDRERADFDATVEALKANFGKGVAPLFTPLGSEGGLRGVVDLLQEKSIVYAGAPGTVLSAGEEPVPEEMADREHQIHDDLVEGVVVADDSMMERYLEGDAPSFAELESVLAKGVASGTVFPVVCGSAATGIGIDTLSRMICEVGPSPLSSSPANVRAGDRNIDVECGPDHGPLAYVFKTVLDPYVGRISVFKVLAGTVKPNTSLMNPRTKVEEKLHGLFALRGKEHLEVSELGPGDIGAVAKLSSTLTGDTLTAPGMPVFVQKDVRAEANFALAVSPLTKGDEDKMMTAFHRLLEEDPYLDISYQSDTNETVLSGGGETHLQIACERLARRYSVDVETTAPKVAYLETISGTAQAEGKYKKQTGGHGQFGVVDLRVAPAGRGEGFKFVDEIVGGAIPRQFIPAVEKGVAEAMARGGPLGFPVVDLIVTCFDGKFHAVDSSEMSFKMAASLALHDALASAHPVLLEPISRLEIKVPSRFQGDVMGDITSRRGKILSTSGNGESDSVLVADVPSAEVIRYSVDLRSMTGGRGTFTSSRIGYEPAPDAVSAKVVNK